MIGILLLLAFLVVPVVELAVIIQVDRLIGLLPTLALLIGMSIAGAWLVRREGTKAWRRFRDALNEARVPTSEVVDGALVLLGGALMLTPGFVTDIVGLLLVLPGSRTLANRAVRARGRAWTRTGRVRVFGAGPPGPARRPEESIDVEVVDVERSDRPKGLSS